MEPTGVMGAIHQIADKVSKLAYLNLLWIVFTLMGLFFFGLFPATIAMFTVLRKIVLNEEFKLFRLFWGTYKKEFFKGNLIGLVLVLINGITYTNFVFFREATGAIEVLLYPMGVMGILLLLMSLFVFPVYVHFDLQFLQIFKTSFIFMLLYPLSSLSVVVNSLIYFIILYQLPVLVIFFSASIIGLIIMTSTNRAFKKNAEKIEEVKIA